MEQQLFDLLTDRLTKQDEALVRIDTKLDKSLEAAAANTTSLLWVRAALGAAWAAVLTLAGVALDGHRH
jgi:hypothetical protein